VQAETIGKCVGNAIGQVGILALTAGAGNELQVVVKGSELGEEAVEASALVKEVEGMAAADTEKSAAFLQDSTQEGVDVNCLTSPLSKRTCQAGAEPPASGGASGAPVPNWMKARDNIYRVTTTVDTSLNLYNQVQPTVELLAGGTLTEKETQLASFVVRNQLLAGAEALGASSEGGSQLIKLATNVEKNQGVLTQLNEPVYFTQPDFNMRFSADTTETGFPYAGQNVLDAPITSQSVVPELFVTTNDQNEVVLASNNNRGLASLQNKKLPITNVRFILEKDATNFFKNGMKLFTSIKEITGKVMGEPTYGRTVTVGPETHLIRYSDVIPPPLSGV
jgi:hypothetical protein